MLLNDEITIVEATSPQLIEDARYLFLEYGHSLDFSLCFQGFEEELKGLPGNYSRPEGFIYVARNADQPIGCIALRKLEPDICELKRMYILPEYRGSGTGKKLLELAVEEAGNIGYKKIRLDTLKNMQAAVHLYKSFGFYEISPYCFNPLENAVYMEKTC